MTTLSRSTSALCGLLFLLTACSSTEDRDVAERRARSVYPDGVQPIDTSRTNDAPADAARADDPAPLLEELEDALGDPEEVVAFGLRNSASLRARFEAWRASAERVESSSSLPDPTFTYAEFLEEVQTRTGPQERRFGISQAFPWPGSLDARARVAGRDADAAWQRVEQERLRVAAEVAVTYHAYAFLGRELEITDELIELLHDLEPVVQGRVRAGGGQEDLLRLQVEIGRLEDDLESLRRRRPAASARLADALGVRAGRDVLPLPELVEPARTAVDVEGLYAQALKTNPTLLELVARREAGRERERLVDFRRKPNLAVGFDYIQTGDALDPTTPGSGNDPYMVKLSFSLPVWRSSYTASERAARHDVRSVSEALVAAELQLRADLEAEAFQVEDALRRARLYRESLTPRARESLELTMTSYRGGGASVLDLIDSERALLEFQLSYWRACRDALQGAARLQALIGGGAR